MDFCSIFFCLVVIFFIKPKQQCIVLTTFRPEVSCPSPSPSTIQDMPSTTFLWRQNRDLMFIFFVNFSFARLPWFRHCTDIVSNLFYIVSITPQSLSQLHRLTGLTSNYIYIIYVGVENDILLCRINKWLVMSLIYNMAEQVDLTICRRYRSYNLLQVGHVLHKDRPYEP